MWTRLWFSTSIYEYKQQDLHLITSSRNVSAPGKSGGLRWKSGGDQLATTLFETPEKPMPILGFHGTRFENDCSKVCRVVQRDEKQGQQQVFQGGEWRAGRQVAQVSTRAGHGEGREARRFGS